MKTYVIGMCDSDSIYMKRLAEYFMHKSCIAVQIMIFSEADHLIEYLGDHTLDVLITGGDVDLERFTEWFGVVESADFTGSGEVIRSISWGIYLHEMAAGDQQLNDKMFRISRYRSSAGLLQFVQKLLQKNDRKGMEKECADGKPIKLEDTLAKGQIQDIQRTGEEDPFGCCVIGVYSPVQRCGKTSLAVLMTQYLSKHNPTLLISMDQYAELFSDQENNLAELIFKLSGNIQLRLGKRQEGNFEPYQGFVKQWGEISYIASPEADDLRQISGKQIAELVKLLKEGSSYRYVVMDLGGTVEDSYALLESCRYIFSPSLEDCISRKKQQMFEQWVKKKDAARSGNVVSKLHRISMPEVIDAENEENYYRELMWSNFGKAAGELLRQYGIG